MNVPPKTLFVLDLDRTMANTKLYDEAEYALESLLGDRYSRLKEVRQTTERSGGSFDFLAYLKENDLPIEGFLKIFMTRTQALGTEAFRNKGATELLERLARQSIPLIFMTYGGREWQRAKLAAAGYESFPTLITDTKQKGHLIAAWQQPDGSFIPDSGAGVTGKFERIVLVDDKAEAFAGLPAKATGYLLVETDKPLPSQQGVLPPHVVRIQSLDNI